MSWRRMVALLAICGLGAGCRATVSKEVHLPSDLRVSTLVVYPVGFRWDEPADRGALLGQRIVNQLLVSEGTKVALLGPGEFRILRAEDDHAWAATDLLSRLRDEGLASHEAIVLRPWAERLVASSRQERTDAKGRPLTAQQHEELTWVAHLEVLAPQQAERILELSATQQVDPFARASDETDPTPELTRLFESLVREALSELSPREAAPSSLHGPLVHVAYVPPPPPTSGLEGEVQQMARVGFLNPGLGEREATVLAGLPTGLYVRDGGGADRLHKGDLITLIDGQPALPQTLARAQRRGGACTLHVRRDGEERDLPCP